MESSISVSCSTPDSQFSDMAGHLSAIGVKLRLDTSNSTFSAATESLHSSCESLTNAKPLQPTRYINFKYAGIFFSESDHAAIPHTVIFHCPLFQRMPDPGTTCDIALDAIEWLSRHTSGLELTDGRDLEKVWRPPLIIAMVLDFNHG
jgi:hypothetical protein